VTGAGQDEEAVLLDVVTPDGRRHAVAALADVPLRQVAAALVRLLGCADEERQRLAPAAAPPWDEASTLREVGALHGTVVRLVPHEPTRAG
jgi:hypothetical protein